MSLLSPRQQLVVGLVGRPTHPKTYKQAAATLGISLSTAYVHAFRACHKLGVDDVRAAYRRVKGFSTRQGDAPSLTLWPEEG